MGAKLGQTGTEQSALGRHQPGPPASAVPCRPQELHNVLQPSELDPRFSPLSSPGFLPAALGCSHFYLGLVIGTVK